MDQALLEKALALPPNDRVVFAELMLASIEYEDNEIRQSWITEVNERMQAVSNGKAKLVDFEALYNDR